MISLPRDARHERRVQVIWLRKSRLTYDAIAAQTDLSRTGVFDICKRHDSGGTKALRDAVGGCKLGDSAIDCRAGAGGSATVIRDNTPDQIKLPYALCSRGAVAELIADGFGIRVPVCTMGTYLKRWGFTPQKPIRRAYEQSPTAVKHWMDMACPEIAARAKKECAEIHWGDDTGLRQRRLSGAGLDVFEGEPKFNPGFLELDNVTLTPYIVSSSAATRMAIAMTAADNLIAALSRQQPPTCSIPKS